MVDIVGFFEFCCFFDKWELDLVKKEIEEIVVRLLISYCYLKMEL